MEAKQLDLLRNLNFPKTPPPVEEEKPAETVAPSEVSEALPQAEEKFCRSCPPAGNRRKLAAVGEEKTVEETSPRVDTPEPFAIRWGMPLKLTWKDTDDLAYALIDAHPDQDPLKLSFPKLHKMIIELEDFGDDPDKSNESVLESIQMAWYEEVK